MLLTRALYYSGASICGALIYLGTLPLATRILSPEDYGIYALVLSATGVIAAFATGGVGLVLFSDIPVSNQEEQRKLVSSTLVYSIALASIIALGLLLLAMIPSWISRKLPELFGNGWWLSLAAFGALLEVPWLICMELSVIKGEAKRVFWPLLFRSLVTAGVLLACLYFFKLETSALFVSYFVGNLVLASFAAALLWQYLCRPRIDLMKMLARTTPPHILSGGAASAGSLVANSALTASAGVRAVGLYNHAQYYSNCMAMLVKAMNRAVWPENLEEARREESDFALTGRVTRVLFVVELSAALFFLSVGEPLIGLLTNQRFNEASEIVVLMMLLVVLTSTARAHQATLIGGKKVRLYGTITLVSDLCSIGFVILLIPLYGIFGAIMAKALQLIVTRGLVVIMARKLRRVPFQDAIGLAGSGFILLLLILGRDLELGLVTRVTVCGSVIAILLALVSKDLRFLLDGAMKTVRSRISSGS